MDEWFKKYAEVTPLGIIAFTLLWWGLDGQKDGFEGLAGFVEFGIITYAAFLIALDRGFTNMFYTIAQIKKKKREDRHRILAELLEENADNDEYAAMLKQLLEQAELKLKHGK